MPSRPTGAPPHHGGRRRPALRRFAKALLFVALAAGIVGLLPQLGGRLRVTAATAVLAVLGYRVVSYWLRCCPALSAISGSG